MVSFGAVMVWDLSKTFYGKTAPITDRFIPEALAISGHTREEHEKFDHPSRAMVEFKFWLEENVQGRPIFISDNPAFDWQFINYYFHRYLGDNPFGYSARRIGDIWSGGHKNMRETRWEHLRQTKHTHNPVDDAMGNAEALLQFESKIGMKGIR
jgi:hypothetical protein